MIQTRTFLFVAVIGLIATVSAAGAATSPNALRAAILKAELAKNSVHYVTVSSASGGRHGREVADVSRNSGIQRLSLTQKGKKGQETTLVVHSTGYLHGDAFALHAMGFPKSFVSRYAGKWILIPHNSPLYAPLAQDVTLGSFVRDGVPQGHLALVSGAVGGKAVRGLRGKGAEGGGGTLTVYVPNSGAPLAVEGTLVGGAHSSTAHIALSHWNEPVHVHAPAHAVRVNTPQGVMRNTGPGEGSGRGVRDQVTEPHGVRRTACTRKPTTKPARPPSTVAGTLRGSFRNTGVEDGS